MNLNKKSLEQNFIKTKNTYQRCEEVKDNSETAYFFKKRKLEISCREFGSGKTAIAEQYPELTSCMLSLFDGCGAGLQTHPRLICETLFVQKKSWLDMPRAVTILNDIYNIPISLSAAYTYTENYR